MAETIKIIFTGGGSSGHVTPNLALIEECQKLNWDVGYIGSYDGIERELIAKTDVRYYPISCGKLRRYFSWRNFCDPFKIFWGIGQAFFILRKSKPNLIFSKGGFVSFPVVFSGWLNRIPIVIHESDFTPGLANRLSFPFATKICVTFSETAAYLEKRYFKKKHLKKSDKNKIEVTGTPIRTAFFQGNADKARAFCHLNRKNKKTILIYCGGLGSEIINNAVRQTLSDILTHFNVIHLCGKGKMNKEETNLFGYAQFDYLHDELFDVMALADIVVSRAGANSLYELLVLKKPHILIPLSKKASRGDQIANAAYFEKKGLSMVIQEQQLTKQSLLAAIQNLEANYNRYQQALNQFACPSGTTAVMEGIRSQIER